MLKLVIIAFACLLLCVPSLLVQIVDAAATCPASNVVSPCSCSSLGTDRVSLDCYNKGLTDARIDLILEVFAKDPTMGPLGSIDLGLNSLLTRVPSLIQTFTELGSNVLFYQTGITSIDSGAFNFLNNSNPIQNLFFYQSIITTIAPNAFKGDDLLSLITIYTRLLIDM